MLIRVNKKISAQQWMNYGAVLSGTISDVWYDEETASATSQKRRNHIRVSHYPVQFRMAEPQRVNG